MPCVHSSYENLLLFVKKIIACAFWRVNLNRFKIINFTITTIIYSKFRRYDSIFYCASLLDDLVNEKQVKKKRMTMVIMLYFA